MKPPSQRRRPWLPALLALLAITFFMVMARTGKLSETRQLAKFVPQGVLQGSPEQVQRVTIRTGERTATFVRHAEHGWVQSQGQGANTPELQEHLTMALLLMHASGPVRVLAPAESQELSLAEFGLAQPRYSVLLADAHTPLLEAHFGASNPQELLQYMRLTGSAEVYLMSRFVGQAWEHIGEHAYVPAATP